jgi:hypothetical protein
MSKATRSQTRLPQKFDDFILESKNKIRNQKKQGIKHEEADKECNVTLNKFVLQFSDTDKERIDNLILENKKRIRALQLQEKNQDKDIQKCNLTLNQFRRLQFGNFNEEFDE